MKIHFLPDARTELLDARKWYEEQRLGLGAEFLLEFKQCVAKIVASPERFVLVPRLAKSRNVRQARVIRFPYSIVYRIFDDQITILAVAHHHRKPAYWHKRLKP